MSKLSFRARALDASKPMPIFRSEEIPDLPDFAAINRAVPQMPTGMEKEEECEHHLQRAISAQQAFGHTGELVIPTPEVYTIEDELFDELYPPNYKISRQLIHMQPFAMDQDIPDYDMDSEDEKWLTQQAKKMEINPLQFEEMMDRLEKGSGQQVVTLHEAKTLLKEDDDLIIAVYDYWLNKRLRTQCPLVPQVKSEKRDGSNNSNPYVAFRRRTEKMQTRKNRKNDEASYEKMLKLRRDLSRAVTLLEMVKRREKTKREHLHLTIEVFEKRYQVGDFTGQIMAEVMAMKNSRPSYVSVNNSQLSRQESRLSKHRSEDGMPRRKREYTKRRNKETPSLCTSQVSYARSELEMGLSDMPSSDDEALSPVTSPSDNEDENDPDGPYAFKRKKYCNYHAPLLERLGNYPWCSPEEGGAGERKYRYCLTTLTVPKPHCIGFARRRIGRGGRVLLDRAWTPLDDYWPDLDVALNQSMPNGLPPSNDFLSEVKNEWLHFRPQRNGSGLLPETSRPESLSGGPVGAAAAAEAGVGAGGGSHHHPGVSTPVTPSNVPSSSSAPTTDYESFQSHQEELFEMQRKQLERLKGVTTASGASNSAEGGSRHLGISSGAPLVASALGSAAPGRSSHSTLDPASVEFAVSALLSTTEVSGILNSLVSSPSVTTAASLGDGSGSTVTAAAHARLAVAAANGPSADAVRTASEGDLLRTTPKQQPGGQVTPDAGAEADSHVMAALPPVELGNKLPASLTDLRYSILEQNGNEGNKARHELSSSNLGRVKLEPDGALPMDVT
ncbi:enhancer of Polycomb [Rhipicephalus microplus]|uniref:enhancer of Polycomb n=1 Tax=Rhipicephalus microplus TaxID=6941 RepID=UPI003F6D4ED1